MTSSCTGSPATVRTTRTVRASALYDLVVTAGFALPITAPLVLDALGVLHARWGLAGTVPSAEDAYTLLFANLTGSLVVVWSVYRLVRPSWAAGAADVAARALFSLAMIAALGGGASPLLLALLVPEIGWGVFQALVMGGAWSRARRTVAAPRVAG